MSKRIFSITIIFLLSAQLACAASLFSLQAAVDWSCANYQIVGLCFRKSPPWVGIKIRYWEPYVMAETVKKPGDSVVDIFGQAISPLVQKASSSLIGATTGYPLPVTSGSNTSSLVGSNLQFNEVHIYKFPFLNTFHSLIQLQCSTDVGNIAPVVYLSELDAVEWRIGLLEALSPKSVLSAALGPVCGALPGSSHGLCMGTWGPVYPRRGFITHQSEVVGSAADVYRSVSIASLNGELFHTTLSRLMFVPDPDKDKLQLIYPHPSGCIRIGQNPATWESGKTSPNGKYAWIYWRHRECCIF